MTATIAELGMSEEWFWETEPRIVVNMIKEKNIIEKEKAKQVALYIASYVWGNDPDEKTQKGVAGIDHPVSEEQLKAFNL